MRLLRIIPGLLIVSAVAGAIALCQGRCSNPDVAALIQGPSAIEAWQNNRISIGKEPATSRVSPLVAQARIYAGLLNPPKPVKPIAKANPAASKSNIQSVRAAPQSKVKATPQKASPTFKVHATSVFAKAPEKSMALISEPGKGLSWIRPGDMLGYLKVTEIRTDSVMYAFKDTTGQVAWEPGIGSVSSRPRTSPSAMAMNLAKPSASPSPLPAVPASPLPSRLAAPQKRQTRPVSPRPRRGGR